MPWRPRVALNAQLLRLEAGYRSAGISRYILNLLRNLANATPDFDLHAFTTEPQASKELSGLTIRSTLLPTHHPIGRILWEQTQFPWQLLRNFELLHSLAYVSPLFIRVPAIVTVYDLSFFLYPAYFRPLHRLYLRLGTRRALRQANRVIAISHSTKRDLVHLLNVPAEKIDVIPPGVEAHFFANGSSAPAQGASLPRPLDDPYVLFVGTREPRKNIPTLIRAFAQAKRAARLPHRLVLVGGRGWLDEPITRAIRDTASEGDIIFPGFVSHKDLPQWYRCADAFVYPSQYEGFGMPVLEALAAGVPVITSNVSALPESAGDAALLIDPRNPDEIADALVRVLTDGALCQELRRRGPQWARTFTWARAAEQTAQCYRRVLGMARSS